MLTLVRSLLQDQLSTIYCILVEACPSDFPPSFFVQAARVTLQSFTSPSSLSSNDIALRIALNQLCVALGRGDPAVDHGDCIEVAYAALNSPGKCLSCCHS